MQNLINETTTLHNEWTLVEGPDGDFNQQNIMIPADYWLSNTQFFSGRKDIALWLAPDTDINALSTHLNNFNVIAINFPAFADGRGYSLARLITERYNFKGELRAIGDVLIDQLFFMKRCGFNSYLLKDNLNTEKALASFNTFSQPYQMAADIKEPLFRRKG